MIEKDDGGPAFPFHHDSGGPYPNYVSGTGMTLRDYFAAKAMPAVYATAMHEAEQGSGIFRNEDWRIGIALDAYAMADAMLKARES